MDVNKVIKNMIPRDYCPICEVKKLIHKLQVTSAQGAGYPNGAALTPPMGWSSWNLFAAQISEDLIKEIADAMVKSGLSEYGYQYVNIDDCWQAMSRDENGRLQCDPITFPSGMRYLSEYVNTLGLKLGLYSSNGTLTCQNYPASLGHEKEDAETIVSWGIEYFKYDFCHNVPISTYSPRICALNIGVAHQGEVLLFQPSDFRLSGRARLITDNEQRYGNYIAGLSSHNGKAVLENIEISQQGQYILTFFVKTGRNKPETAFIKVNDTEVYRLDCPSSHYWEEQRRDQICVELKKGKNKIEVYNPVGSVADSSRLQYTEMGKQLLKASERYAQENQQSVKPVVFSICEWGRNLPWKWARQAGNLWRTTPDIMPIWASVVGIYEVNVMLWKYADVGGWNDPDMLEVGNGKLTYEENKSHFSLWCMLAAPLILGNDIRKFIRADGTVDTDSKVYQILTNRKMIDIDQDALGKQCRRIKRIGCVDVLVKPLTQGRAAVCLFNKGNKIRHVEMELQEVANDGRVDLPSDCLYTVENVWEEEYKQNQSRIDIQVQAHGVKVYIISAQKG